jgi:cytochrome o ubiquinol oxidase subunit II
VNRPLSLRITSSTVMNSLYIPELAGQIYAMPGMETKLHGVLNRPGVSQGFSANYSGAGFSGMKFVLRGLQAGEFDKWVATVKTAEGALTRDVFLELEKPTESERVRHFASVDASLYDAILGMCVAPGRMCRHEMMAIDERGSMGGASAYNVAPFVANQRFGRAPFGAGGAYVVGLCTNKDSPRTLDDLAPFEKVDRSPLVGAGLPQPQSSTSRLLAGGAQDGR